MSLNESRGFRGYNPLIPKLNRQRVTPEQKSAMVEKLYGRTAEEENMFPTQTTQEDTPTLAALGLTPELVEALRRELGVMPKAQMKPQISFDINNPPPPQPPIGGWRKIPCIVHRLNAKTGQSESKICKTAHERDHSLSSGWHALPQAPVEVDPDPEIPEEEARRAYFEDREAKKTKKKESRQSQMVTE